MDKHTCLRCNRVKLCYLYGSRTWICSRCYAQETSSVST
jgi:hypothetical protein